MDPNLFHLDWERTWEALVLIVVLSFLIERALAVLFENRLWLRSRFDQKGAKEIVAAAFSIWVCFQWDFDAVGMIILTTTTTAPGKIITGLVIAGGSKASIKLFHDVFGVKSTALAEKEKIQTAATDAAAAVAAARAAQAAALAPAVAVAPISPVPPMT